MGWGDSTISGNECRALPKETDQGQEISSLGGEQPLAQHLEKGTPEVPRSLQNPEAESSHGSCSEEQYFSPLPELDIEELKELLPDPPSSSSINLVNVTDAEEEGEQQVKLLQAL